VAIYIQGVCNYVDEVQGLMALAFAYRHLSCVKVFGEKVTTSFVPRREE
jgi:hypothetical protein